MPDIDFKKEFYIELTNNLKTRKEECYNANYLIQMVFMNQIFHGIDVVSKTLRDKTALYSGINTLKEKNRPELALELLILAPEYKPFFNNNQLEIAKNRFTKCFPEFNINEWIESRRQQNMELKYFFVQSFSNEIIEDIKNTIDTIIKVHEVQPIVESWKSDFESNKLTGVTYEYDKVLVTIRLDEKDNTSYQITFEPYMYGDGELITKFKENHIVTYYSNHPKLIFMPVPNWVSSDCDCKYSSSHGTYQYYETAKRLSEEYNNKLIKLFK